MGFVRSIVLVMLAVLFGAVTPSNAVAATAMPTAIHAYGGHHERAPSSDTLTECGPPREGDAQPTSASHEAADPGSHRSSARPNAPAPQATGTDNHLRLPVRATDTPADEAQDNCALPALVQRWQVAANSADEFVDLASASRRSHILDGHRYGGEAGNTWFPRGWSDDKILHSVSDIATDPSLTWVQQTGRAGAAFTRGGAPVRYTVEGGETASRSGSSSNPAARASSRVPDSMTTTPTPEEMAVRLHKAMDAAVGLTPDDISNVQSLIDVGEWLVAFETLCTQIYEWELRLERDVIRDLEDLGTALGARRELTDHLWEDVAGA
jgi:hypothetical protein